MPQLEREERFSPEMKALFADWVRMTGIKVVLFDLDDTLFDTSPLFVRQFQAFYQYAKGCINGLDIDTFAREFEGLNDHYYQTMGVSVKKFDQVVTDLSKKYNTEALMEGLHHLYAIYETSPDLYDGAEDVLSLCKSAGLKIGAVTHATDKWTDIKLMDIGKYFDGVFVIDIEKHKYKKPEHWKEAIEHFGFDPIQVMVVGDNVNGDIKAAHSVGVRNLVRLATKWKVYDGTLPEGAIEADKIGDLISVLCQKK